MHRWACTLLLFAACLVSDGGIVRMSGQEATETKQLRKDRMVMHPLLFPVAEARRAVRSLRPLGPLLAQVTSVPYAGRRLLTRCKWTRMKWRQRHVNAVNNTPLVLPFRSVNGSSITSLPIEPMTKFKTFNKIVPRAYIDQDAWSAARWVFTDLGARYYIRRHPSRCFGSTFEFQCGYPGAHRFEYYAFDINATHEAGYPPFVRWTTSAIWDENTTIVVKGKEAGAHADEKGSGDGSASDGGEEGDEAVPGLDFSDWLLRNVRSEDFLVVKMDIENAEFRVFEKMYETGAIELVDEVFIECHGELTEKSWDLAEVSIGSLPPAWVRSEACLALERRLRRSGIFLHEWD